MFSTAQSWQQHSRNDAGEDCRCSIYWIWTNIYLWQNRRAIVMTRSLRVVGPAVPSVSPAWKITQNIPSSPCISDKHHCQCKWQFTWRWTILLHRSKVSTQQRIIFTKHGWTATLNKAYCLCKFSDEGFTMTSFVRRVQLLGPKLVLICVCVGVNACRLSCSCAR